MKWVKEAKRYKFPVLKMNKLWVYNTWHSDYSEQCAELSHFSCVRFSVTRRSHLSMGFTWQEYRSGLSCPPPGNLLDLGVKPKSPVSPTLQVDSLPAEPPEKSFSIYS